MSEALGHKIEILKTGDSEIEDSYALSPLQQGMLFHHLSSVQSGVDVEQMVFTISTHIDRATFRRAWELVIERHGILRTSFEWEGIEEPLQSVHKDARLQLWEDDWRHLSTQDQHDQLNQYLQNDRQRGFDLARAPLMRVALFRVGDCDHVLIWTFHHALLDGRSSITVLAELYDFYESLSCGKPLHLEPAGSYREHMKWLKQVDTCKAEDFWRETLKGFRSSTPLNFGYCPGSSADINRVHGEQEIRLTPALTSSLKSLASECGVTLYTLVQAAWALLLSRYSGERDVVFGATRACRRSALDAESMVGLYINTLPVHISVPANQPLRYWLQKIREQHVSLREYEYTPLQEIRRWCEVPGGEPLFESILVFENYELPILLQSHWKEWRIRNFKLLEHTSYPLSLSGWSGEQLELKIEYDIQRFDQAIIGRMLGHLETLLDGFRTHAYQPVSKLPMLTEAEKHQIVIEWNDTKIERLSTAYVQEQFEQQVQRSPDGIAVICENGQVSYRDLNASANRVAHYLGTLGVGPETLVGLSVTRSLHMIVGLLGILKAGGAYVPIDPSYPKERLAAMLQDARVPVLLTEREVVENLPHSCARVILLDSDLETIRQHSADNPDRHLRPDNSAYVIYTSGSTGKPKGVLIEHRSLADYVESAANEFDIRPGDRVLQFASLSFDTSAEEIYPCLTRGGTLILRSESMLSSTSTFLQQCNDWGITVLDLPTAYWRELTASLADNDRSLPPSIRLVIIGGEQALPQSVIEWHKRAPSRVRLLNTYGPTEATIVATFSDLTELMRSGKPISAVPVGRPMPNVQTCILDRHDQLSPIGVIGELHIGGIGLARGYLNRPDLTTDKFISNPFSEEPGARLYRTGDLARYAPDGNIQLVGRADNQVKINGFRIELGEIEIALRSSPDLHDAIVLAREDILGDKQLVAYVIPSHSGSSFDHSELRNRLRLFLKNKLPSYMQPLIFVSLAAFPISPTGKVDRKALPAPDLERPGASRDYVRPRDPLEKQLIEIWEDILNVFPVGIRDNFFELGGHSLLSVRMIDRIDKTCGKKIPPSVLFEEPTVEHLATIMRRSTTANLSPITTIQRGGAKRPFFFLHGDYNGGGFYCSNLARGLGTDQPFYAIHPHGLDGGPIPGTVEAMADCHLKALRSVQPEGPYLLGGYCNGAAVAFEMARRLQSQGEKTDLLVLLGVSVSESLRFKRLHRIVDQLARIKRLGPDERLRRFVSFRERLAQMDEMKNYYRSRLTALSGMGASKKMEFLSRKSVSAAASLVGAFRSVMARRSEVLPAESNPTTETPDDRRQRINELYRRALLGFVPEPYQGRVTVLWPSELSLEDPEDPTAGWSKVAAEVEVRAVPGGHITCLTNKIQFLAEALRACLETYQAKNGH